MTPYVSPHGQPARAAIDGGGPQPGDFYLTQIGGHLGWWIRLGQFLAGGASEFSHAGLVLDRGQCVEAMPAGARTVPLADVQTRRPLAFSRLDLTPEQRARIVHAGRLTVGAPYGFSDYFALALARVLHQRVPRWLARYIAGNGRLICSQLVDQAYTDAGVHLFDDGRLPGQVMPGDLANLLLVSAR